MTIKTEFQETSTGMIRARYPWEFWTDGNVHRAYQGEDFLTSPRQFQMTLASEARRSGLKYASTVVHGSPESVRFQFFTSMRAARILRMCPVGEIKVLLRFADFHETVDQFKEELRRVAHEAGLRVKVLVNDEDESLAVLFRKRDE